MRGEYKVPDGKLVAVDFEIIEQRLARISVSGDFFLEPDDALETINAALTGMPETASAAQLGQAITAALDDSVTLIGFSADAIGIAIRRALGRASGWHDHVFDVIEPVSMAPIQHVALDEVMAEEIAAGRRGPTLRLWDWNDSVVVIGAFQSVANEVDVDNARHYATDVVRRITGGGAMFMEPGNCITYSLIVPASLVEGLSVERSYAFLDDWVLGALADVGIDAHYVPLNDIVSDQGKIGGAAQKRFSSGLVVHHATLAYDMDADRMTQVLRIGREKVSDKGIASADKRVDPMRAQTGMARTDIMHAFLAHFRQRYTTRESQYTREELSRAEALAQTKFRTREWTYRVP